MSTLLEITYDIRDAARAGGIVDDERINWRQVKAWVNQYRALLIRRDLDKGKTISDHITQDLGCVPLIEVDASECCNVVSNCGVLRTAIKIPVPIELSLRDAIHYVGSVNKREGYELSSPVAAKWDTYNKYTANVPRAYYFNGYIYVTNEEFLEYINIRGIFNDPTEARNFNKCNGDPCYTDESDYPINQYMIPLIKQMIFQNELRISLSTTPDTTNNSTGNAEQKG